MLEKIKNEIKKLLQIKNSENFIKQEFIRVIILTVTAVVLSLINRALMDPVNEKSKILWSFSDGII